MSSRDKPTTSGALERTERRLGPWHFHFFKGYLQSSELRRLTDAYLEPGLDLRLAKKTALWIRDELLVAARRQRKFHYARLIALPPAAVPAAEGTKVFPSLAEFRQITDPSGSFYREGELIELYLKAFPAAKGDRRDQRNTRLMERQVEALSYLQQLVAVEPILSDPVDAWLDPNLSKRLQRTGINTLEDLVAHVCRRGARWWTRVPRLGKIGAGRISFWLEHNSAALDVTLPAHALVPLRQVPAAQRMQARSFETGIAPLERLAVPEALSGRAGRNRAEPRHNLTRAEDDYNAIQSWLRARATNQHTARSYRKEAERLLLWAILEQQTALSSMSVEDCADYRDFLAHLGRTQPEEWAGRAPQCAWIGSPQLSAERWRPDWKPFDKALSGASVQHALTVVGALFAWLVEQGYLARNPWRGIQRTTPLASATNNRKITVANRLLTQEQWMRALEFIQDADESPAHARLRFVLPLAYGTGLRTCELVAATCGDIVTLNDRKLGDFNMLQVRGKGAVDRLVPFAPTVMQALKRYLRERGLHEDPGGCDPATPLIGCLGFNGQHTTDDRARAGLSASRLYKILKAYFRAVSLALANDGFHIDAQRFNRASTHWLRHAHASHAIQLGVRASIVQANLGHKSLTTTAIYTHEEEAERHRETVRAITKQPG
jgi:site-specific recombinase XerD